VFEAMKHPNYKKDCFKIDILDEVCWEIKEKVAPTNPLGD